MDCSCRRRQQGFTIVELLIVVVVIAILAAISMVAYQGIQQRAKLAAVKAATVQMQKSLSLVQADSGDYPTSISSCPNPVSGSACLPAPSGYTVTYTRLAAGASPAPASAGTIAVGGYEYTLRSGETATYYSNAERTGTNEFLQYVDMAPIIDQYGLGEYQISFDIKSANTASRNTMSVYMQNGSGARYTFETTVPVTTSYVRQRVSVTPVLYSSSIAASVLAFYGTYGTGNIASVKNLEIVRIK